MNEDFFKIISRFADVETRHNASCELAGLMYAEEIFCFLFDPVSNTFLPAAGFSQTLKNSKDWQRFLSASLGHSCFTGNILLAGNTKEAVGLSPGNGCVLVLINCKYDDIAFSRLGAVFILIAALLKAEASTLEIENKINTAKASLGKAEQLNRQLDDVKAKLKRALKTGDEFLSSASHELKTPVTSINGFVQILQSIYPESGKEKQTHYMITRIKFQVDRLIRLIGDLIDATKIRSGKLELNVEEVFLDKVLDNLIRDYSFPATTHKIIKKGSRIGKVSCDKNRIEQVISNLLDNAIKHSPAPGKIIISIGRDKNNALFSVQDFGSGIERGNKNKIFDHFFRAYNGDPGNLSGLGLGLCISANIIKEHNGNIWVDSEQGKGSTFHFSLPVN